MSTPETRTAEAPMRYELREARNGRYIGFAILDRPRPHNGVDIVARPGTPIVAAAHGRITHAGPMGEYGLTIEIEHGYGITTRYAHASRLLARVGQTVARGDTIARVGQTGLAVGPHLHYEVLVGGQAADPRMFILQTAVVPD